MMADRLIAARLRTPRLHLRFRHLWCCFHATLRQLLIPNKYPSLLQKARILLFGVIPGARIRQSPKFTPDNYFDALFNRCHLLMQIV